MASPCRTVGQVLGCCQDRIVQHMRLLLGSVYLLTARHGLAISHRTGPKGSAHQRCAGILAMLILNPLQSDLHAGRAAEIRPLVDRIAISEYGHLVEWVKPSAAG